MIECKNRARTEFEHKQEQNYQNRMLTKNRTEQNYRALSAQEVTDYSHNAKTLVL